MDCPIKKLVKEQLELIMEKKITQKCFEKFQNTLFGSNKRFYGKIVEPNTKEEEGIWREMLKFVSGEYMGFEKTSKSLIHALMSLKACTKDYPNVLKPDTKKIYRGTSVKAQDLIKRFKLKTSDVDAMMIGDLAGFKTEYLNGSPYMVTKKPYTYAPTSKVQSWTSDVTTAIGFSDDNVKDLYDVPVIVQKTFPENELLFNTKFMNTLHASRDEFEIIRIGKQIKADVVYISLEGFDEALKNLKGFGQGEDFDDIPDFERLN